MKTPAQFGFALRSWLRSGEAYAAATPSGTWTEGGCWLLAEALLRWAEVGELWTLWGKSPRGRLSKLQHVVWRQGDLYFDGDGASREETLLLRAAVDWAIDDADLAPWGPSAAVAAGRDIQCPAHAVSRLASALRRRFGKPSEWGFIQSTGRARRGRAVVESGIRRWSWGDGSFWLSCPAVVGRGRGALVQKIRRDKLLYHGTCAPDDFEFPDGPAWFSDSRAVAEHFVAWNSWGGDERPRVLTYRVTSTVPRLARIRSRIDMECFAEEIGGGSGDSHEMAEAACAAGYAGWIVPSNYPDGADILLCHPAAWLEFVEVKRVKVPAGRATRERAVEARTLWHITSRKDFSPSTEVRPITRGGWDVATRPMLYATTSPHYWHAVSGGGMGPWTRGRKWAAELELLPGHPPVPHEDPLSAQSILDPALVRVVRVIPVEEAIAETTGYLDGKWVGPNYRFGGRAARERAVVPSFGAQDLHVHPYVSPRQRRLSAEEKVVRRIAVALKKPGTACRAAEAAAPAVAALIDRPGAVLVPVPDSRGSTAANLVLVRAIAARLPGAVVVDGLVRLGGRVRSSRARRRLGLRGLYPEEHGMGWAGPAWVRESVDRVYFVDNVIVTAGTIEAARRVLGGGTGLAWARQALHGGSRRAG